MCLSLKRGTAVANVSWETVKAIGDKNWSLEKFRIDGKIRGQR